MTAICTTLVHLVPEPTWGWLVWDNAQNLFHEYNWKGVWVADRGVGK